jgi:hypothetical protein
VYCLWEPSTSHVFNSFHITFTEHLNAEPSPLLPGKTLGTENATCPPSWESPGAPLPPNPPLPSIQPFTYQSDLDELISPSQENTQLITIPYSTYSPPESTNPNLPSITVMLPPPISNTSSDSHNTSTSPPDSHNTSNTDNNTSQNNNMQHLQNEQVVRAF